MGFAPDRRNNLRDLAVGHVWQAREHFPQVGVGIKAATPAAFDDGVEDGAALASLGITDEEPVFLVMTSSP